MLSRADVTDEDRRNFQKWLKKAASRYRATHGRRVRPGGQRRDHASITGGSVAIGKEILESVPKALAALVVHGVADEDDLDAWVGSVHDVAVITLGFLKKDRDSLGQLAVIGLWCEDDDCRCFIRPVSGRLNSPDSFTTSAVCAACGSVTIIWSEEHRGLCVRYAPRLKRRNHPMEAAILSAWVQREQPPTERDARLIAPSLITRNRATMISM